MGLGVGAKPLKSEFGCEYYDVCLTRDEYCGECKHKSGRNIVGTKIRGRKVA